jgi:predicted TIM-barrel fold metal-dependent hydrolase
MLNSLRITDAHIHFGIESGFGAAGAARALVSGDPANVLRFLGESKLDRAIIMPLGNVPIPSNADEQIIARARSIIFDRNRLVAEAAALSAGSVAALCYVNPFLRVEAQEVVAHFLAQPEFCGVNLNPHKDQYRADNISLLVNIMHAIDEAGASLMVDSGYPGWSTPEIVGRLAKEFSQIPIVLTHMGTHAFLDQSVVVAREYPNVFLDSSGGSRVDIERILRSLSVEKLLFGSDAPWGSVSTEISAVVSCLTDDRVADVVFWQNAERVYDLNSRLHQGQ